MLVSVPFELSGTTRDIFLLPPGTVAVAAGAGLRGSLPAVTVRMAGLDPVFTLAVAAMPEVRRFAPFFMSELLIFSLRVNCEDGSIVTRRVTDAVLVAASTKAGPVYLRMRMKIARIANMRLMAFGIEVLPGSVYFE